jgi:hypothetical protein
MSLHSHSTRSASDKVYQLLAHGRWFSPASSTTKTGRHDIAEILLKVALNTINQNQQNDHHHHLIKCNHDVAEKLLIHWCSSFDSVLNM